MINIEIWASGGGSNADKIIKHFKSIDDINIVNLGCNRIKAGAFHVAFSNNISSSYWSKETWTPSNILSELETRKVDVIILAGFLKLVPQEVTKKFEGRMLNLHPSLLPKFGGKDMYGEHVHKAVLEAKEPMTGITIHEVNEQFDKGKIVAQFACDLKVGEETLDSIKSKIQNLEHSNFPSIIEAWVRSKFTSQP